MQSWPNAGRLLIKDNLSITAHHPWIGRKFLASLPAVGSGLWESARGLAPEASLFDVLRLTPQFPTMLPRPMTLGPLQKWAQGYVSSTVKRKKPHGQLGRYLRPRCHLLARENVSSPSDFACISPRQRFRSSIVTFDNFSSQTWPPPRRPPPRQVLHPCASFLIPVVFLPFQPWGMAK